MSIFVLRIKPIAIAYFTLKRFQDYDDYDEPYHLTLCYMIIFEYRLQCSREGVWFYWCVIACRLWICVSPSLKRQVVRKQFFINLRFLCSVERQPLLFYLFDVNKWMWRFRYEDNFLCVVESQTIHFTAKIFGKHWSMAMKCVRTRLKLISAQ